MKKLFLVFLFTLVGCATSKQSAIVPTETTPMYEKAGFRSSIEPLLFQENDLPGDNWVGDTYLVSLPDLYTKSKLPQPAFVSGRIILNKAYGEQGFVLISFYENSSDLQSAYDLVFNEDYIDKTLNAKVIDNQPGWRDLAFVQCDSLVHIHSYGPLISDITSYAIRLKDRLQTVICP